MTRKLRVAILFGGRSAEHEVSVNSARNVLAAIDREKYEPVLIAIDKSGRWLLNPGDALDRLNGPDIQSLFENRSNSEVVLAADGGHQQFVRLSGMPLSSRIDVIFPILHGTYGEDGTVQGLARLANLPCVGPGVLASAAAMDKDVAKRLMRDAGIPVSRFLVMHSVGDARLTWDQVSRELGSPVFVKPCNMGSSVGISKVSAEAEYDAAIQLAFDFDTKIILEEAVPGREIEVAVLGNEHPKASVPGEIIPTHEFYSYDAKYIDDKGAGLDIPAKLSPELTAACQTMAIRAYQALCCTGMSRVDMFLLPDNRIYMNEINTIPGFTKISMYPKLWEYSGISYTDLIDQLIQLAIQEHQKIAALKTSLYD